MAKRDYYEILGIERNATGEQIKKAFRNKARNLHPDNKDSGDEAAFKELAAAYEVLSDEQKRSLYDRFGHDGLSGGPGGFEGVDFGAFGDLSEIFSQFFAGGAAGRAGFRRNAATAGADLKYDLNLEFLEAVFGCEKKISVKHLEDCTVCSGSGAAAGSGPTTCSTCSGAGQIRQTTATFLGHFTQVLTCPNCQGEGTRVEKTCNNCKGRGQVRKTRDLELKVPPGIDSGSRLRVPNAGDQGRRGGPPGDVYVIIHAGDHPDFIREGTTIHLRQPISFSLAALGGELAVPTVDGGQPLAIAPGTQSGATMVMRDKGVPHLSHPNRRGDQVVHLMVETPVKLSGEEKKLLEKLAELRGEHLTISNQEGGPREKTQSPSGDQGLDKPGAEAKETSFMDKIADFFGARDASES